MSDFSDLPCIDPDKPWLRRVLPPTPAVINVGSVAMEIAMRGDWDGFEAYLDKFDDSQLQAFINFYADMI